jgi:hypothetical protein
MYFDASLIRSTNAGGSWSVLENNQEDLLFIAFHPDDLNVVYAGNKRSLDGGQTFQTIQYLSDRNAEILGMCLFSPDTIYALSKPRNKIFRSDDRGNTWMEYASVSWFFNVLSSKPTFEVHPTDCNKVYTIDNRGDAVEYDGQNWKSLGVLDLVTGPSDLGNSVYTITLDPRYPNIIYVGMISPGIPHLWRSTDSGETWEDITGNSPRVGASALRVHPLTGDIMQGTCYGTWILPPPYNSQNSLYPKTTKYGISVDNNG